MRNIFNYITSNETKRNCENSFVRTKRVIESSVGTSLSETIEMYSYICFSLIRTDKTSSRCTQEIKLHFKSMSNQYRLPCLWRLLPVVLRIALAQMQFVDPIWMNRCCRRRRRWWPHFDWSLVDAKLPAQQHEQFSVDYRMKCPNFDHLMTS